MNSPVLFLIFSRPDTTARVFEAIRAARPPRLYVAADGPRAEKGEQEAERCRQTRALVLEHIDWPCEVHTLLRTENLGCGLAPYTAIRWFFGNEEEGIVLEDDCLPHPDFFGYCDQLLEKYRHTPQIRLIAGTHHDFFEKHTTDSFYFSIYPHIWGWAGWRRTFEAYEFDLKSFSAYKFWQILRKRFDSHKERVYWLSRYLYTQTVSVERWSFWDYQQAFEFMKYDFWAVLPNKLLIENIGVGEGATHTGTMDDKYLTRHTEPILPLSVPDKVERSRAYDKHLVAEFSLLGIYKSIARSLVKRILKRTDR